MKVAFVLSTCAKFGPFIVARDIVNFIYDKVDSIDVFYIKDSQTKLTFKANCIKVDLFKKTDFSQYDIVHSHGFLGDVYTYLNRGSIKGKAVTTLHQKIKPDYAMNYNLFIASTLDRLWRYCIKHNNAIVTLTKEMAQYYRSLIHHDVKYIYNGITPSISKTNVPEMSQLVLLKEKYLIMGISANLIYRKGIDVVIEALALPGAEGWALLILGGGAKKDELKKLVQKLGLEYRCVFLGNKINAIDYYKYFDIYMMSSRSEGFGLCVIEAASQKKPVVCNDLPVYRELFDDEEVVRFDLNNKPTLVTAINYAYLNRERLSINLYKKYLLLYTMEKMGRNYLNLYETLNEKFDYSYSK